MAVGVRSRASSAQALQEVKSGGAEDEEPRVDKVLHWRDLLDPATGRLTACRPPGAPAGAFPHTPFWHVSWGGGEGKNWKSCALALPPAGLRLVCAHQASAALSGALAFSARPTLTSSL